MKHNINYISRFMSKVDKTGDCWLWTGRKTPFGHGSSFRLNGIPMKAHRAAYVLFKGEIPPGMCVCHQCDVPACVNPDHLWLGTIQENNKDKVRKNRHKNRMGNALFKSTEWIRSVRSFLPHSIVAVLSGYPEDSIASI